MRNIVWSWSWVSYMFGNTGEAVQYCLKMLDSFEFWGSFFMSAFDTSWVCPSMQRRVSISNHKKVYSIKPAIGYQITLSTMLFKSKKNIMPHDDWKASEGGSIVVIHGRMFIQGGTKVQKYKLIYYKSFEHICQSLLHWYPIQSLSNKPI